MMKKTSFLTTSETIWLDMGCEIDAWGESIMSATTVILAAFIILYLTREVGMYSLVYQYAVGRSPFTILTKRMRISLAHIWDVLLWQ